MAVSTAVGPVPRSARMQLAVGLPLRNQQELSQLLDQLVDPASPNFRHYLTSVQFAERFGPSEEDYRALTAFFEANGLTVTGTHPNRMILDVSGAVTDIEKTFHVQMMSWSHPARGVFFAPDREPSLDAGVSVLDITGLDSFAVARPMDLKPRPLNSANPLTTGSGPAGLFVGNDFRSAYAPGVSLNGAGQAVGLFELGGFYAGDVAANFQAAGLPPVPVQTVLLDGFDGAPGGTNVEVALDIMMAAYMAPGLDRVIVYEGSNWNDVLNRMATDDLASQLSSSWSFSPTNATTEQIFSEMIAQGQSMFQASGDYGAYRGPIMPPADDPNITVVGGTSLTTAGDGGAWQSETTWSGSGGGVSTTWPIPSYQRAADTTAAGGSATMRNIPDVALVADVQMFLICNNGQRISVGGTSAAAPLWAGFMALANQQAATSGKPAIGFANPPLYTIGRGSSYDSDLHDITTGNDGGFNALPGYDLATGWGTPTGQALINALIGQSDLPSFSLASSASALSIGSGASGESTITISAQNGFSGVVNLAVSGLPAGVTASLSPSSAATSSTLTLTATSSAASSTSTITVTGTSGSLTNTARLLLTVTGVPSFSVAAWPDRVSVLQGGAVASTITIAPENGFKGAVTLTASGLPTGVTASFSAASATKPATLTLTASSSAVLGTSTVTVTGASGSLRSAAAINLTVAAEPRFTLTASPASLSIEQGSEGATTIAVVPQNGFNGTVALSATGLPYGVTATFNPASTAITSTLTLTAASNASPGLSTVTITGKSGNLTSKITVALTTTPEPSFTLGATPASMNVNPGTSSASTVSIYARYGFDSTVALAATGLPPGVTATFGDVTAGKSGVTFTAASTAAAGTSMVTVTGTSGSLSSKVAIAVTVTPPPNFTLAESPASLYINPGASGGSTISVVGRYGFNSPVALVASGLPAGVSASFGAVTAGRTKMTLTAASTASAGTATVTITGSSGNLTSTSTIALSIVLPPTFTLTSSPDLSIQQGASGSTVLTLAPQNGFTGAVAFTVSGLPAGVVSTIGNGPTPSTRVLTLKASATAVAGTSTVTVTGKSGNVTKTSTISLTVLPASAGA